MTLKELEETVAGLPPEQMAEFRHWFLEFDAKRFDQKIEQDAKAGRFDQLAEQAIREHSAGKSTSL
jgi:hypothetical protein